MSWRQDDRALHGSLAFKGQGSFTAPLLHMKRESSPVFLALVLFLSCVTFRLLSSVVPGFIPNVSPLMAIAFVGAMYLPRTWGWMVGPSTLVLTDLAFLGLNYRTDGSGTMFSWWTLISLLIYVAAGGLGIWISGRKSLTKIVSGSVGCSLVFYVASNTFAWWHDSTVNLPAAYAQTWAGWWQANTVGLAGYEPTWMFLRNGIAGDLFFAFLLLLVLDRGFLFGQASEKSVPRTA